MNLDGSVTREHLVETLRSRAGLSEFDAQDAEDIIDVLQEAFMPSQILTYMLFINDDLEGTPVVLIGEGRGREVLKHARKMVEGAST